MTVHFNKKCFDVPLHFHPEIEIMYIVKGHGIRIVGNTINTFKAGDLVIVGSGISHVWKSDRIFDQDNDLRTEWMVLFVTKDLVKNIFNHLPEFANIKKMLGNSKKGIKFSDKSAKILKPQFEELSESHGIEKFEKALNLLYAMSVQHNCRFLSEKDIIPGDEEGDYDRLKKCIEYITDNFQNKIELKKVADIATMTPNSFCRYFKLRTTKTFSQYVTELRINRVCQLLIDTDEKIENIAFDSGFNAIPNFYNQFNKRIKMSPNGYREKYQKT